MAIKMFCDVCTNEIGAQEKIGTFLYKSLVVGLERNITVKEDKVLLCESCKEKVVKFIEGLKK
jgi:hypothetical protein